MEKKTISVHAFTVHIYTIAIAALIILVVILGLKYWHLRFAINNYTRATMWMNQQQKPTGFISDYGLIVSQAVVDLPAASTQTYVSEIADQLNRDVVVVDGSKKILADAVVENKGTTYKFDSNNEVQLTINDGRTRTFEEKSKDYPNGIMQTVVPMRNQKGETIGAVIISNSQILH